MNVSPTYLSYNDGLNDVNPNAISSKNFMNTLGNTGDNGDPIASR